MATQNLFDLTGKVTVVTGGGRGLCRAMAIGLADAGAHVVVAARTKADVDGVAGEIKSRGGEALAVVFDATSRDDCQRLVDETVTAYSRLDVMLVGHGIERAYPQLRHGEAVALGLIASCAIASERQRMAPQASERIKALLEAYRLPTRLPRDLDVDRVLDAMTADKKRAGGEIVMILPREIGEVEIVEGIPPGEVRGVLSRMVR